MDSALAVEPIIIIMIMIMIMIMIIIIIIKIIIIVNLFHKNALQLRCNYIFILI